MLADGHLVSNGKYDILDAVDYDDGRDIAILHDSDAIGADLGKIGGDGRAADDTEALILALGGSLAPKDRDPKDDPEYMKQQELKKKRLRDQKGQEVYDELARRAAKAKHMEEVRQAAVRKAAAAVPLPPLTRKQQVQKKIKERKLHERKEQMHRYWDSVQEKSKTPYSGRTKQELAAQMAEIRKWQLAQDELAGVPPIVAPVVPVPPVQPVPPLPVSHPDPPKFTRPGPLRSAPVKATGGYMPANINLSWLHHMEQGIHQAPAASGIKVV